MQFAGAGFVVRRFTDERDAIQAPKTLADRRPSGAQAVGAIDVDAQRVGANLGGSDERRQSDQQCHDLFHIIVMLEWLAWQDQGWPAEVPACAECAADVRLHLVRARYARLHAVDAVRGLGCDH